MKKVLMGVIAVALVAMAGAAMAADTATVAVSATVVGTCKFTAGGTIPFGNLDPSVGTSQTPVVTQPKFWCTKGTAYTITDDDGLYESGPNLNRMKHLTLDEHIPYSFTYTASGTGAGPAPASVITMDILSTVLGADYANASAGSYADTVTLSISP
jgi:spore coat protein U-like protein